MKKARDKVFIWISWLAKLVAGEIQCEFSCWFKSHFSFDKLPSDFNLVRWTVEHNQLIHKTRDELEKQGYEVAIEDQNSFKVIINGALVSAKPDIVAVKKGVPLSNENTVSVGDEKLVIDCKTGRPKNSDQVQVLLYMMYLPHDHQFLTSEELQKLPWEGRVVYKKTAVPIPSVMLTKSLKDIAKDTIGKLSGEPARKVPSERECRKCDISETDCPERLEDDGIQY